MRMNSDRTARARYDWYIRAGTVVAFLVLALAAVGGIMLYDYHAAAQDKEQTDNWSLIVPAITANDHTMGDLDAPVQVIVFSDFQCQYCGPMYTTVIPRLQQQYGRNIVVAYRQLPLRAQPQAEQEAEASECIYQLGGNAAFWRFASIMYAIPNFDRGIDLTTLPDIASRAGVDATAFSACMKAGRGTATVQAQKLEGAIAGLATTPSTVLKSSNRALVVVGNYYAPLSAAVSYLLDNVASSSQRE
jgi:protein-disulfide isomerase